MKLTNAKKAAQKSFNTFIRFRDKKCVRCGSCENLQASHYFKVGFENVRFDEENVDTLCYRCHYGAYTIQKNGFIGWEYDSDGYREFKLAQLGEQRFKALEIRARLYRGWRIPELLEIRDLYDKKLLTP